MDPLNTRKAIASLEEQAELLKPRGLKLYPTSWDGSKERSFRMDDAKLIYPLYERAAQLGLRHIAIHKAVPVGPFPVGDAYSPQDLETAAADFPHLSFEIVHGGVSFVEETAWLLARYPNIYVNMEMLDIVVERRPRAFAQVLLGLCRIGGGEMLKRLFWGSGGTLHHPQPGLEAFVKFEYPEDLLEGSGLFGPIRQIAVEDKRNMLAGTFARLHGIDIEACKRAIANDEFSRPSGAPLSEPYSTISMAEQVKTWRQQRV